MSLINIARLSCSDNIGSIQQFFFIPLADVSEMAIVYQQQVLKHVQAKSGKKWYNGKVPHNTGSFKEDKKPTPQGSIWHWKLLGVIYKDEYAQGLNFYTLDNLPVLIQYVDSNGTHRLLGDPEHPVLLTEKLDTTGQYVGANQWLFEFTGEAPHPAYYYPAGASLPSPVSGLQDPLQDLSDL